MSAKGRGKDAPAIEVPPAGGFAKNRIEALTDGICAIVMTLLVLELMGGPLAEARNAQEVTAALVALWPKVASFVISFVVAAILWVAHHSQFHWVRRTDRRHIWINLLFLLALSLLPFSAALLGAHPGARVSVLVYGANVIAAGAGLLAQWQYAVGHGLLDPARPPSFDHAVRRRMVGGQIAYWAAMAVAVVSPRSAFWLYVVYALGYVVLQLFPEAHERGR